MASPNTNTKVPTPSNPSALKPRYEIRKLEPEHEPWASALVMHSNLFHSPLWPVLYPTGIAENLIRGTEAAKYLVDHQIYSGWSFGVFDTEYQFKREESKATGGKLYWDANDKSILETEGLEAESKRLLDQMDFPLVSVALSYDAFNAFDMEKMGPLMACLPHFGVIYHILTEGDKRDPNPSKPTATNQVLNRNATSTRHEYEGEHIMSALARWLMREAAAAGWKAIQIECVNDAVTHVWSKAPAPFKSEIVTEFNTGTWKNEEGELGFKGPDDRVPAVRVTKCFVDLDPKA
jgi:hypothetical protein